MSAHHISSNYFNMNYCDTIGKIIKLQRRPFEVNDKNKYYEANGEANYNNTRFAMSRDEEKIMSMLKDLTISIQLTNKHDEFSDYMMNVYEKYPVDTMMILAYMSSIDSKVLSKVSDIKAMAYSCIKKLTMIGLTLDEFLFWSSVHIDLSELRKLDTVDDTSKISSSKTYGIGNGFRKTVKHFIVNNNPEKILMDIMAYNEYYSDNEELLKIIPKVIGSARIKCRTKHNKAKHNLITPEHRYLIAYCVKGFEDSKQTYIDCYEKNNNSKLINMGCYVAAYDYVKQSNNNIQTINDILYYYDIKIKSIHDTHAKNLEIWKGLLSKRVYKPDEHAELKDKLLEYIGIRFVDYYDCNEYYDNENYVDCVDYVEHENNKFNDQNISNNISDDIDTYIDDLIKSIKLDCDKNKLDDTLGRLMNDYLFDEMINGIYDNSTIDVIDYTINVNDIFPYLVDMIKYDVIADVNLRKSVINSINTQTVIANESTINEIFSLLSSKTYVDLYNAVHEHHMYMMHRKNV